MNLRFLAPLMLPVMSAMAELPAVGPDYRRPDVPTPGGFRHGGGSTQTVSPEWWTLFADPVLTDLLERVDAANHDLHAAAARIAAAEAALRGARSEFFPRIDATASATRADAPSTRSFGGGADPSNDFRVGASLSYEIDLWGRVRRSARAALADWQASEALASAVRLSLKSQTARTYFALRSIEEERSALDRAATTRREALRLTESREEAGLGSELDIARAQTELSLAESDSTALTQQRAELEHALAVLAGEHASTFRLAKASIRGVPRIPAGVPGDLLLRRPDIAASERRLAASAERIGVAKSAFYPRLSIGSQIGATAPETQMLKDRDSRDASIGLTITIPLWDGGARKAQLDGARAAYDEQASAFHQAILVAAQEAEDALSAQRVLAQQETQNSKALTAAKRAAELSRDRYQGGLVSYFEVVDSDRTMLQVERNAARLRGLRMAAAIDLIRALGGGWGNAPAAPAESGGARPVPVSQAK